MKVSPKDSKICTPDADKLIASPSVWRACLRVNCAPQRCVSCAHGHANSARGLDAREGSWQGLGGPCPWDVASPRACELLRAPNCSSGSRPRLRAGSPPTAAPQPHRRLSSGNSYAANTASGARGHDLPILVSSLGFAVGSGLWIGGEASRLVPGAPKMHLLDIQVSATISNQL